MPSQRIGTDASGGSSVSSKLEQVSLNSVREVLPDRVIEQACRDCGHTYRQRVLTPVVTVLHMILSAIWPEESFQASWHLLWDNAVGAFATLQGQCPSSGVLAKARGRLPMDLWQTIGQFLSARVQELSEPFARWLGHRVILVDGTCVSMPAKPGLFERFGSSTGRGGRRHYPLARMVTLALANTMAILAYAVGRYEESELSLLRPLLGRLRRGDLLLADRAFAGANLYAEYQAAGLEFLTRAHQRLKVSKLVPLEGYAANDFVTDMAVNPSHRRKDPALPKTVRVRLIQATLRIRGKRQVAWFVTSLLDGAAYRADQVVQLYGRRWRIETLFLQLKVRLSADVLRSKTAAGVLKELCARMVAMNVVRAILLEAAAKHGQDPMALSFVHALRAILAFAPILATAPMWRLPTIYQAMLHEIACHCIPFRPGRLEPRAVRRERKHYPRLRCTRDEWRQRLAA
jgi:hypothetical protein